MALTVLPTLDDEHEIVCTLDASVSANGDVGWVPAATATVGPDADRVIVRVLNMDERAVCGDAGGFNQNALARARTAIIGRNGKRNRDAALHWLGRLPGFGMVRLLGLYVHAISEGEDPQPMQRHFLGEPLAEDDDDGGE